MRINNILTIIVILFGFSGCTMRMGPKTYNIFKKHRDFEVGFSIFNKKYTLRYHDKQIYNKKFFIYIVEYPKGCIFGYITDKKDKKQIIINWKTISGKQFCKEQEIIGGGEII